MCSIHTQGILLLLLRGPHSETITLNDLRFWQDYLDQGTNMQKTSIDFGLESVWSETRSTLIGMLLGAYDLGSLQNKIYV